MHYYYNSLSAWLNFTSTKTYSNASFIPYFYNGANYDYENGASAVRKYEDSRYYNYIGISFPTTVTLWEDTNTFRKNGRRTGYPALLTSKNAIDGLTELPTSSISGKYKIPSAVGVNYTIPFSTVKVKCSFNDDYYDYISFTTGKSYSAFGSRAEGYGSNYTALGFIKATDSNSLSLHVTSWSGYLNQIIDFGEEPQIVPTAFKEFFDNNFEYIFPYSYTVKSFNGVVTLASITESPSMNKALLTVLGNQKTLTLTGVNGVEYTLTWESNTPEGKQFLGLSNSPESNRVIVPLRVETFISWVGDITLYESYGTYRPPATTFDINLYQNSAEVNRVDKGNYLVGVGTLSGALREECSMLTPIIVYQSSDVPTFNYVYIPIFNRYYYVSSLSSVSKNVWRMELKCDVLMTYKEQIFLMQGVIGRQEIDYNPLLVDNELPTQNDPIVEVIDIPSDAFNTQSDAGHNFLITVIGA